MSIDWRNREQIAKALLLAYPDVDRYNLALPELYEMIVNLPGFQAHEKPSEDVLKTVLWQWMRLADGDASGERHGQL